MSGQRRRDDLDDGRPNLKRARPEQCVKSSLHPQAGPRSYKGAGLHQVQHSVSRRYGQPRPQPLTSSQARMRPTLEGLPNEILQRIFLYSCNCDLPLVSHHLIRSISGKHLQRQIIRSILAPLIPGVADPRRLSSDHQQNVELQLARSIVFRRFFSWELFRNWLHEELYAYVLERTETSSTNDSDPAPACGSRRHTARALSGPPDPASNGLVIPVLEQPAGGLFNKLGMIHRCPPMFKRGPWTHDKCVFLEFYVFIVRRNPDNLVKLWTTTEPLDNAIRHKSLRAVRAFCGLRAGINQQTLELALPSADSVWQSEPRTEMFSLLAFEAATKQLRPTEGVVDFLSPKLWAWAREEPQANDGRGAFVELVLKQARLLREVFISSPKAHKQWNGSLPTYEQWINHVLHQD